MYTGPVTITGVPEPLPHNPVPFLSKGLGGHSGQGHRTWAPTSPSLSHVSLTSGSMAATAATHCRPPRSSPSSTNLLFSHRSPQFSNPNEAGNEHERKWEAAAAQHHPEHLWVPRGRVPQGAARCFQTLLQPRPPPWLSRPRPPPSALQLWVPAQGAIKGVSPSVPSPPPAPVLGCNPAPEQRALSHRGHTRWPQEPGGDGDKIPPLYE